MKRSIDGLPVSPPDSTLDDPPKLPPFRTFWIHREAIPANPQLLDVMLIAHGYDTENGIARFFVFCVEVRDEAQGPIIVQYVCRAFKEWTDIEEVYQTSQGPH